MSETASIPVVCVAMRHPKGIVLSGDPPKRHCDLIREIDERGWGDPAEWEQGFCDAQGDYLTRTDAAKRVLEIGQRQALPHAELFSEDLF